MSQDNCNEIWTALQYNNHSMNGTDIIRILDLKSTIWIKLSQFQQVQYFPLGLNFIRKKMKILRVSNVQIINIINYQQCIFI